MDSQERREQSVSSALDLPQEHHDQPLDNRDDRIKTDKTGETRSLEVQLQQVPAIPLTQMDLPKKLGWGIIWLVAIGVGFLVTRELPTWPQWIFYPIVLVVLVLQVILKHWLFSMSLRLDSRMLIYGPPWSRKRHAFGEIMAVQLLHVARIAKKNKKDEKLFEINIVVSPENRVHVASVATKEKATNIALSLCDIIKAPLIEQLCA
jgi:hypothetical protein